MENKHYIFLDTNIWLNLYSKNKKITSKIENILSDSKLILVKNDILKMEIMRNRFKEIKKNNLTSKEANEITEKIKKYFNNHPSIVINIKKIPSIIDEVKWRDFTNQPPHYSPEHEHLNPDNHNDSLLWLSLIKHFSSNEMKSKPYVFDFYSNDRHFWNNKDFLSSEWIQNCLNPINIKTFNQFENFKIALSDTTIPFTDCQNIYADLNEITFDDIPQNFIKFLISIIDQHPISYILQNYTDPRNVEVIKFYVQLVEHVENNKKLKSRILQNMKDKYIKLKELDLRIKSDSKQKDRQTISVDREMEKILN